MKLDTYVKFLFLYSVDGDMNDVWAFAHGGYNRFTLVAGRYRFVRAQKYLPLGAAGVCYQFTWSGYEDLRQEANRHTIQLGFYDDVLSCEQGEILKDHPEFVFGLSNPAGTLWQGDEIENGGGDDSEERE